MAFMEQVEVEKAPAGGCDDASVPAFPIVAAPLALTRLGNGRHARVEEIRGEAAIARRLESMGLVAGTVLLKKSAAPGKGPIVVEAGCTQIAVGYALADRVVVRPVLESGPAAKRAVLVGNPNVGKSLLFSRITKSGVITANYAGTTVDLKLGRFRYGEREYEIVDGPGLYSLEAFSEADRTALRLVEDGDVIVNVLDATNLERNLNLTLQLLESRRPMVVCLNMWDDTAHRGVSIDAAALEAELDLPVVATSALSGEGVSDLVAALERARPSGLERGGRDGWSLVGGIVGRVQRLRHRHHTPLERLSDFAIHPVGGLVTALAVLGLTLGLVRLIGEGLAGSVLGPLYERFYGPFVHGLVERIPWDLVRGLLVGRAADPLESFGILTSGIYIALVQVFPYFVSFYLVLGFLEDFGYLPRLAVVLDKLFHRMGLHGYSSIPVLLGLGCKVPAFLSTRTLTDRRQKILTITLIAMSAPCLPQTSMIVALGMGYGVATVAAVFLVLLALAFATNAALNKLWRAEPSDFFGELPPYRLPRAGLLARKLRIRVAEYFAEVLPLIAAGVLAMNILDSLGVIEALTRLVEAPVRLLLGLPAAIAPVMLLGFLRKDVSIAMLAPLGLSASQFVVGSVFLALYLPCVSSFFVLAREAGAASAIKIVGLVLVLAVAAASLLHLVLG